MSYLPHGHMALFIKMVTTTTSTAVEMEEEVGLWRGAVGTAVVSIIAIASGGSAGPEGPVLAIGGAISLAVHSLLGATTSDKAVDGSGGGSVVRHGHRRLSSSSEAIGPRMVEVLSPLRPIMVV